MDFKTCREAVYSNEWYDFMLRKDDPLPGTGDDVCLIDMDGNYQFLYIVSGYCVCRRSLLRSWRKENVR